MMVNYNRNIMNTKNHFFSKVSQEKIASPGGGGYIFY